MLIIVPCGGKKLDFPAPAGELYTGPYHRACRAYAAVLNGATYILSAKYGLLPLEQVVQPYNLRMGEPGSVDVETVKRQAKGLGIFEEIEVVALGGRNYVEVCRAVWPNCSFPLKGVGGIGKQLKWLKMEVGKCQ